MISILKGQHNIGADEQEEIEVYELCCTFREYFYNPIDRENNEHKGVYMQSVNYMIDIELFPKKYFKNQSIQWEQEEQ